MKRLGLLLLMSYAVSGGVADAATYYVSKAGSNNNSCAQAQSLATTKLTINAGISCLSAGDTLLVRAGDYDEGLQDTPMSGTSWSNKIRIANYNGETVWMRPLVSGVGNDGHVMHFYYGSQKYVEFDGINLDARNMRDGGVNLEAGPTYEPHHFRFQNLEAINRTQHPEIGGTTAFFTIGSHALVAGGAKGGSEFKNLVVHGGGVDGDCFVACQGYAFYVAGPNNLIENCEMYDGSTAGIHIYNANGDSPDNNIIRNNRIHHYTRTDSASPNTRLWGILVTGNNNQIYNNIIYGMNVPYAQPAGDGITVLYGNGNKLWNNTITDNIGAGIKITNYATNTEVRNNILYRNTAANYSDAGIGTTCGGTCTVTNLIGTNPLFVNTGAFNFAVTAGSPARNTGTTIATVTTDVIGTARPKEGIFDIGAHEFDGLQPSPPTETTGLVVQN